MRLFSRIRPRYYALGAESPEVTALAYAVIMGAPDQIAECYASYIANAYPVPDADLSHKDEWLAWEVRNLAVCQGCASPWAIFVPCVSSWECWGCGFTWDAGQA